MSRFQLQPLGVRRVFGILVWVRRNLCGHSPQVLLHSFVVQLVPLKQNCWCFNQTSWCLPSKLFVTFFGGRSTIVVGFVGKLVDVKSFKWFVNIVNPCKSSDSDWIVGVHVLKHEDIRAKTGESASWFINMFPERRAIATQVNLRFLDNYSILLENPIHRPIQLCN